MFDIIHHLSPKLYLNVGAIANEAAFNGMLGYISLFLGPGSYRKGLKFGYNFNFDLGAMEFFKLKTPNRIYN